MHPNIRRALLAAPLLLLLCLCFWSRPVPRTRAADPSVHLGRQEVNAEIDDGRAHDR